MGNNFRRTSPGFIKNILINNLNRKLSKKSFFRPILPSFFATLRCNLKCTYCGLVKSQVEELSTGQTYELLEKIRPGCQALSITGGEPLVRSDILGVKGAAKIIIGNIEKYVKKQKEFGFRIVINPVITSENIVDIYEVMEFCTKNDVYVSPVPEDDWTRTNRNLIDNPKYYKLINDIIEMKKEGHKNIAVTNVFLNQILNFSEHNCLPTLVPRIYPDGSVFYPCTPLENKYGKLQDHKNLIVMLKEAFRNQGNPDCTFNTKKCFMSCFMEPTNMIEKTCTLMLEQIRNIT
jgi:MoaA/NifB/PqqE/SkfB family radical SAM enzyme